MKSLTASGMYRSGWSTSGSGAAGGMGTGSIGIPFDFERYKYTIM